MFSNNPRMVLVGWVAVLVILAIARRRTHTAGVGLVLAYIINLWMIHFVAGLLYALPWYPGTAAAVTVAGTEQSLYAVAAFAFGSIFLSPFVVQSGILPRATGIHEVDPRLPRTYLYLGAFFYFLSSTPIGSLPTLNAIISSGQELVVVGIGLCWWQAMRAHELKKMGFYLGLAFLLPLVTIITRGFIGTGAAATISVLIFISNFSRSKIRVFAISLVLIFAGLSVYVTYMRDRAEIRRSVWGGDSLSERLDRMEKTASSFEFFDPFNPDHLARIDERLNQSALVGTAVFHLEQTRDFARGETLYDALLALIPRAIWPDKPIGAGSGKLVSRYTGLDFRTGNGQTSVGIGSVLEFYVNFGTAGIVGGFLLLGIIVTTLDVLATERLANNDLNGFVLFYLPGLAFLQVGGQLVEVTASAAGSVIVAMIANKYLHRYQRMHAHPPGGLPPGLPGVPPPLPLHR